MLTTEELVENLLAKSNKTEIFNSLQNTNYHVNLTFKKCCNFCDSVTLINRDYDNKLFEIESVLDYLKEEINTGHWSLVPIHVRRAYTAASYIKCLIKLKTTKTCSDQLFGELLNVLDMGLLLGAPLEAHTSLLTESATFISQLKKDLATESVIPQELNKKRKHVGDLLNSLPGQEVPIVTCPSLEAFRQDYFLPQKPVKLVGCMSHWRALEKWNDVNYLIQVAGDRTVPIEIGSHYADENWSQKLITLKEFIVKYFLSDSGDLGYLAQHNLFDQIPELRNDIHVPDYCCLTRDTEENSESSEPDINAWFGPKGTVSPLHHDPKNNFLSQIFGTKQIILIPAEDSEYLYPYQSQLLCNTAQVNPLSPNLIEHPLFSKAKVFKCLLEPGEILFIPEKWWHHVTALDKSFSVSFWWK